MPGFISGSIARWLRILIVSVGFGLCSSGNALAQTIPPPTNPVVFCGTQALPEATSYQLAFDGGAFEALTMDAAVNAGCPAGTTHSFSVVANRFTVGTHTLQVKSINAFGQTDGPVYTVTVGIAPGPFTIHAVIGPSE